MSAPASTCPDCGAPLEEGALCRRCLVEQVLIDPVPDDELENPLGEIGDYEILEKIARGGMGIVYRARQKSLDRIVAVKLIPEGRLAGAREVQRFRMEAAAAAELNHPNIISVHEIGEEDGQHFFSMRLVEGGNLAERLHEFKDDPEKSVRLIVKLARAVHFAHQRGILHRDLKPGNILIDRDGEPQIMDFGLAKRVDGDPHLTMDGQVLGSPAYMAPELLTGAGGASTVSEVYSLGVILYQLLAGRVPFEGTSQLAIIRHVTEEEPGRLADIDRDLETVCLKSMAKEPARRYGSAEEFATDLENWLEGRPVIARPVSQMERLIKWTRRKPAVAALIAVSVLAAAVSWIVLWKANTRITEEKNRALASEKNTRLQLYVSDMNAAQRALDAGNLRQARGILTRHVPEAGHEDLRGFEWRYFWHKCQGDDAFTLEGRPNHESLSVDFSPDGKFFAVGGKNFTYFYDRETRECLKRIPEDEELNLMFRLRREFATLQDDVFQDERSGGRRLEWIRSLAFLGDSDRVLLGGMEDHGMIFNWRKPRAEDWFPLDLSRIVRVPESDLLAVGTGWQEFGDREEKLQLVHQETLEPAGPEFPDSGGLVDVSADGKWFLTGDNDGNLKLFSKDGVARAMAKLNDSVTSVALSPDGMTAAATLHPRREIYLWDIRGKKVHLLEGHRARAYAVDFSPDGSLLASTGSDHTVCLWNPASRTLVRRLLGHTAEVLMVKFSPDGKWLLSGGRDFGVRFWDMTESGRPDELPGLSSPMALSPDGKKLAARQESNVAVLDLETGESRTMEVTDVPMRLRFSADNLRLAVVTQTAEPGGPFTFQCRDVKSGEALFESHPVIESGLDRADCAISPDLKTVAVTHRQTGKKFGFFDLKTGKETGTVEVTNRSNSATGLLFDREDGSFWFALWADRIHHRTGVESREMFITPGEVKSIAVSRKHLAAGLDDGRILIYRKSGGDPVLTLSGHLDDVNQIAFSHDGSRLASASEDQTLRLWCLRAGREITVLSSGTIWRDFEFSQDGETFAATAWGGGVRIWRAPALEEIDAHGTLFR